MTDFYTFLTGLLKTPGLFHISKVEDVEFIVIGYKGAANRIVHDKSVNTFFAGFRDFLALKYEVKSTQGWSKIIRFYSASDHHSLELFTENFMEYYNKFLTDFSK